MSVISLTDRLNGSGNNNLILLKDYYIDDVEISALNFILKYQDLYKDGLENLLNKSITQPFIFCAELDKLGVYSVNQICPWGDDDKEENGICVRADEVSICLDKYSMNFYHNYKHEFENNTEFFRDCLQVYIQAFIDDFNGVEMPFEFGTSKKKARINALKNQDIIILDVISTYFTNENMEIGFYGVGNNLTNSLPYLKQVIK
jgi:hypothetical protein